MVTPACPGSACSTARASLVGSLRTARCKCLNFGKTAGIPPGGFATWHLTAIMCVLYTISSDLPNKSAVNTLMHQVKFDPIHGCGLLFPQKLACFPTEVVFTRVTGVFTLLSLRNRPVFPSAKPRHACPRWTRFPRHACPCFPSILDTFLRFRSENSLSLLYCVYSINVGKP